MAGLMRAFGSRKPASYSSRRAANILRARMVKSAYQRRMASMANPGATFNKQGPMARALAMMRTGRKY